MTGISDTLIGVIGQGTVGRNLADDMERRGGDVVRYSLEPEWASGREKIKDCDVVFICVPTPTNRKGKQDLRHVYQSTAETGVGSIIVLKSTVLPGTTAQLQKDSPLATWLCAPEFLSERSALYDTQHPARNIIGLGAWKPEHIDAAYRVMELLPTAPFQLVYTSDEVELLKYFHNVHGVMQVVLSNLMYDVASKMGMDWSAVKMACKADPQMSGSYLDPTKDTGRGAGGKCFIKDMRAFVEFYSGLLPERTGNALRFIEKYNTDLLLGSGKDLDLLREVGLLI